METIEQKKKMIASKLKQFRLERDLTLAEIASKAGVGVPTVYRIENGIAEPNERTLYKLEKAFPELFAA